MAGIIALVIDLIFAIWAGQGKPWYGYIINFILLAIASGIINTSFIQSLTRSCSYIYLYKSKGVFKAFGMIIPGIIFFGIAFIPTYFVFRTLAQFILFFLSCIIISTIVAFIDKNFQIAIERTRAIEASPK